MVKIRLARHGKRNDPFYRIVAIEKGRRNKGHALAVLGHWYPKTGEKKLDKKAYQDWLTKGAQPSQKVVELVG